MLASNEQNIRVKEIIKNILYLNIATCNNNQPWNTSVYFASDSKLNFYWGSWKENEHSKNINSNSKSFVTIYDSTAPVGTGEAVYFEGETIECNENNIGDIKTGCRLLAERTNGTLMAFERNLGEYPQRIYKFIPNKVWVNDEGSLNGNFIDIRKEIDFNNIKPGE